MIASIIVGRGTARTVVNMVRDKDQRTGLAGAIKAHLFPDGRAYRLARDIGKRNLALGITRPGKGK